MRGGGGGEGGGSGWEGDKLQRLRIFKNVAFF